MMCEPTEKGFMKRSENPENPVAEEPCRCFPGLQCSVINCEYCERIPTCGGGSGLELEAGKRKRRGKRVGKYARASGGQAC